MITVNSLSGGKTSSFMAVHYPADINIFACVCIDDQNCMPKDLTVLAYVMEKLNGNFIASAESEKTLKVMMQLEQKIGKEIVWVRGKSFDEVVLNGGGVLPSWSKRYCTVDMKIKPMVEYIYPKFGIVNENIGFRFDELERAYEIKKGKKPILKSEKRFDFAVSSSIVTKRKKWEKDVLVSYKNYPLIFDKIEQRHVQDYWKSFTGFVFPEDSNCQGCHHKSSLLIKQNYQLEPNILEWFAKQEEIKSQTWHDDQIPYRKKFKMEFTGEFDFAGTSCDMGGCTD
jgi:hypothetical protein